MWLLAFFFTGKIFIINSVLWFIYCLYTAEPGVGPRREQRPYRRQLPAGSPILHTHAHTHRTTYSYRRRWDLWGCKGLLNRETKNVSVSVSCSPSIRVRVFVCVCVSNDSGPDVTGSSNPINQKAVKPSVLHMMPRWSLSLSLCHSVWHRQHFTESYFNRKVKIYKDAQPHRITWKAIACSYTHTKILLQDMVAAWLCCVRGLIVNNICLGDVCKGCITELIVLASIY